MPKNHKNHNIVKNKGKGSQSIVHLFIMPDLPAEFMELTKEKDPTWILNIGNRGNENSFLALKVQNNECGDFWTILTAFEIDEICNEHSPYSQIDGETKIKSSICSNNSSNNARENTNEKNEPDNQYLKLQSKIESRVVNNKLMGMNVLTIYMNYSNYKTADIWSYMKHREDTYWDTFVFPHNRHTFKDQYKKILNDCLYIINELISDYLYEDNLVLKTGEDFVNWIINEDILAGYNKSYFNSTRPARKEEQKDNKIIYSGVSKEIEEDGDSRCILVPYAWVRTIKSNNLRNSVSHKMRCHFIEMSGYEREERFWNETDFNTAFRDGSFHVFYISETGQKTHNGGKTADQVILNSSPIGYICFDRNIFSSGKISNLQRDAARDSKGKSIHFIRILSFSVVPKYREMGVGSSMILTAIDQMFNDEDSIFCEVSTDNIEAAKLLSSIGFACVQECTQARKGNIITYFNEKDLFKVGGDDYSSGGVCVKDRKEDEPSNREGNKKKPKTRDQTGSYCDYDELRTVYLFKYMRKTDISD
jgi:ribosomal protein S18 acetylase RimI-like enzyme